MSKVLSAIDSDLAEEARIRAGALATRQTSRERVSLVLMVVLSGMGGCEFSVVLPSMWEYVQELAGANGGVPAIRLQLYAQAFFMGSTMVTKICVGTLADRIPFRALIAVLTAFGGLGGLTYGIAREVGGVHALLAARALGGAAVAMSTVANAYTVRAIRDIGSRRQQLAMNAASTLVGTFVGPAVVPSALLSCARPCVSMLRPAPTAPHACACHTYNAAYKYALTARPSVPPLHDAGYVAPYLLRARACARLLVLIGVWSMLWTMDAGVAALAVFAHIETSVGHFVLNERNMCARPFEPPSSHRRQRVVAAPMRSGVARWRAGRARSQAQKSAAPRRTDPGAGPEPDPGLALSLTPALSLAPGSFRCVMWTGQAGPLPLRRLRRPRPPPASPHRRTSAATRRRTLAATRRRALATLGRRAVGTRERRGAALAGARLQPDVHVRADDVFDDPRPHCCHLEPLRLGPHAQRVHVPRPSRLHAVRRPRHRCDPQIGRAAVARAAHECPPPARP